MELELTFGFLKLLDVNFNLDSAQTCFMNLNFEIARLMSLNFEILEMMNLNLKFVFGGWGFSTACMSYKFIKKKKNSTNQSKTESPLVYCPGLSYSVVVSRVIMAKIYNHVDFRFMVYSSLVSFAVRFTCQLSSVFEFWLNEFWH